MPGLLIILNSPDGNPFASWGDFLLRLGQEHPSAFLAGTALLLLLAAGLLKVRWIGSVLRARHKDVLDPTQVEELMAGTPPQIVDLRRPEAFRKGGHLRGAQNIPFEELEARLDELDTSHPRAVLLVDETDRLSHRAAPLLKNRGHLWLYVLQGGMKAWRRAKLPLYQGAAARKTK